MARDYSAIFSGFEKSIKVYKKSKNVEGISDKLKLLSALQTDYMETLNEDEKNETETKENLKSFERIKNQLENLKDNFE